MKIFNMYKKLTKHLFLFLIILFYIFTTDQYILAQDTLFIHRKDGGVYKELISNIDSITFSKPILAEWDFPIENGVVNLKQTKGTLALGTFTGFNAVLSADTGSNGVVATGTSWNINDPGIGIILQYASSTIKDFSAVTSITFTAFVENPPITNPGIMAYVQNGPKLNWAGDYSFWNPAPVSNYTTFKYIINKTATNLDIKTIYSFRIKANGTGDSGTGCGSGGTCAKLHINKVVME